MKVLTQILTFVSKTKKNVKKKKNNVKKEENSAQPFPIRKILNSSKLKLFAVNNFKFYENDRKIIKRIENTVAIGQIARYEQFLLFPQCFQKTCTADTLKTRACFGKG